MADTTENIDSTDEVELTEYTSESEGPVSGEAVRRPSASAPGAATGRRKQAIARVRIVPGTGEWKINGRTLEQYFPNKVHQQIVNEPLGGAHRDPKGMATMLKRALAESLRQFQGMKTSELQARRHERLMAYGKFKETDGR